MPVYDPSRCPQVSFGTSGVERLLWPCCVTIEAVIPGRAARAVVYPRNRTAYRRRNVIDRMFGRLKNRKRIATRYDRLAVKI
jgi:transposase